VEGAGNSPQDERLEKYSEKTGKGNSLFLFTFPFQNLASSFYTLNIYFASAIVHQSLNENFFSKSVQTTQYDIHSLFYLDTNLWNSLPITIKQITPFSRFPITIK